MHRSILGIALSVPVIACGGGDSSAGGSCDSAHACPADQICDLTDPDGASCLDRDGDLDGDGLPNGMDLCEHAAGGAFDEDNDGIGDDCDACPIAKPPATAEADHDGVDSPCDPDPRTAGAHIALFQGFNAPLPTTWITNAAWQIKDGAAVVTATGATEPLRVPIQPSNHLEIFADYRIDQVASNADVAVAAIDDLPMGRSQTLCGGQRLGGADLIRLQTSGGDNSNAASADLFEAASLYGILAQIDGGAVSCAYNSTRYSNAIAGNTNGESMNQAGLYARGATVRFSYILVVEH